MPIVQSRRHLLTNIAVAGATGFAGLSAAAQASPHFGRSVVLK